MTREWVDRHKRICELIRNSGENVVTAKEVSEKIGSDRRTVEAHFQVMDVDDFGKSIDGKALLKSNPDVEDVAKLVEKGEYDLAKETTDY